MCGVIVSCDSGIGGNVATGLSAIRFSCLDNKSLTIVSIFAVENANITFRLKIDSVSVPYLPLVH